MSKEQQAKQKNILIIKLSALGDFIQSLGLSKAIRAHHPDVKITLLTTKPFEKFAQQSGYFDNIFIDNRPKLLQLRKWWELKKTLNQNMFSCVYDLQSNDRTKIYKKLFSTTPQWINTPKNTNISESAFTRQSNALSKVDIENIKIDTLDWIKSDIGHFDLHAPYALIVPGCAPTRPEKRWPAAHYSALCTKFLEQGIQPVILGTKDEKEITSQIAHSCPAALNLTEKTSLFDIVALARNAQFSIGNDTGPMHLIAPTGCKTLVIFSKYSNPIQSAPLGEHVQTIQQENIEEIQPEDILNKLITF